jgi:hypothetical protein
MAINSHFFTSIQMHTEAALSLFCEVKKTEVRSSRRINAESLADSLPGAAPKIRKQVIAIAPKHPEFGDYLSTVFKCCAVGDAEKRTCREWFDALSVLRNKSAHSDPTVNSDNIKKLTKVNLGGFILGDRVLLSPRLYRPTSEFIVNFLKSFRQRLSQEEFLAAHRFPDPLK